MGTGIAAGGPAVSAADRGVVSTDDLKRILNSISEVQMEP